ncbi:hypothetical protein [Lentilactobacillus hilgardii]|uniref:hypothetical protein n=1 Tax=Lentilactobacillus hilgardii TaxID=1588 RepID=UPI0005CA1564|nr:hypothetical protein [Lentilactobacillus hilgardii]MCT2901769.1 hypothetical protein [Lentilactobacillus buchneri]BEJ53949.1 hypothetical protein Ltb232_21250 [Lentilactobacillus buchneri subsp. silagei]MCT3396247.1 hypothetical protein [Lentilactobacillus hilgardii]MCT3545084.1 hypothetical protein [Lentilactobacillus buchneri]GED93215.1 hypothetical protein LBSG162_23200 [Lentilactobacillus buchneri subsp. silagei]
MSAKDDVIMELKRTNRLLRLLILINVYGNENSVLDRNIMNSIKLLDNNYSAKTLFESKKEQD